MGDIDFAALKATVTENNGEISCSVEETNRLRALLGLKPLKISGADDGKSRDQISVENFRRSKEDEERARDAAELKEKIERSRSKRLMQSKLGEATLGDADGDDMELVSAAEWVQRSRKKAEVTEKEKQRLAAEQAAKRLDEEDQLLSSAPAYSSADLKGFKVMHGTQDFEAGEAVILTLADSSVLHRDENGKIVGVSDEVDVLENINIAEDYRRKQTEERKKKARRGAYSGYDDDEFAEGVAPKTKRSILSQYDREKVNGPQLVLAENGFVSTNRVDEVKDASLNKIEQNLALESKVLSDYLTPAEFSKFNKPKKEKKLRKIRKKSNDEDPYAELMSTIEDSATDRGSRKVNGSLGLAATTAQEEARRREAYDEAVRQDAARNTQLKNRKFEEEEEDDDLQIATALARARQVALKNRRDEDGYDKPLSLLSKGDIASIAIKNAVGTSDENIINSHRLPKVQAESKDGTDDVDVDVDGRDASGTLFFTDTTEFTSRLQARLYERDREKADAAFQEQANKKRHREREEEQAIADFESNKIQGLAADDAEDMDIDGESSESDADEDMEEIEDNGLQQKPIAARGLAATLELLKSTGDLQAKEVLAGRVKDSREFDPSAPLPDAEDRIKLEYRDKFGRKLTQKEAFRQLSYKFHGIQPSRKKKEKTLKALATANSSGSTKGSLESGTMKFLTQTQAATGKAHVTVQGGATASSETIAKLAKAKLKKMNSAQKK